MNLFNNAIAAHAWTNLELFALWLVGQERSHEEVVRRHVGVLDGLDAVGFGDFGQVKSVK